MALAKFIFQKLSAVLSKKKVYLTRSLNYRKEFDKIPLNIDYIRYSTLGLCYEEIIANHVSGNVAELGVYQGNFSMRLNVLFPDRKLYLFDTFEGFDQKDIQVEKKEGFSSGEQDFSDTSVEMVMKKMKHPENCIVRKGMFPSTAAGIEDRFCFVSLDADLYEPIYQGLKFFFPRLETGGYIFIHDFNNEGYKGAREAVVQYCKENNISYVPIPDSGGTAIITK
jgi:O-methyltransferase